MNKLLNSFSQFSRREQTILLCGAIVLALILLWLLVIAPLKHKEDALAKTNAATEASLGRVQLLAKQIEILSQQSNQSGVANDNLSGLVNASVLENGLQMSTFVPGSNGEVRVGINKAGSEALMQWLYDLEIKHQIVIRELTLTSANDPGQVAVGVRLVKP